MSERLTDDGVRHALAHLEIGEAAVQATIIEKRFSVEALARFFSALRNGHRAVLEEHAPAAAGIIEMQEQTELDPLGPFGQFAGRMGVREDGLVVVETVLHHTQSPALRTDLRSSLQAAVGNLT